MTSTKRFFFSKLLLIPFFSISQKQNLKQIELDLLKASNKLYSFNYGSSDSIEKYSEKLRIKTIELLSKNPATLKYPFKMLVDTNRAFEIVTSEDSLFRIYSWDTWTGGTMHFFNNIFQYSYNGKVITEFLDLTEDDPSGFYSDIFTLRSGGKTYYLVINNGMYSTKDVGESIQVFTIEKGKLDQNVKLIKTSSGMTSIISVEFDFFSVANRSDERPVRVIKYDKNKKIIYIAVVYEDGKVTDKLIQYKFNGKYFEKYKIE